MEKEILNKFVTEMSNILQGAKDFTLAQAPDIFKQIIYLGIARSLIYLAVSLTAIVFGVRSLLFFSRGATDDQEKYKNLSGSYCDFLKFVNVVSMFTGVLGLVCTVENLLNLATVWIAPKVYLIEFFANLVNGKAH
jgi:hypothetical protein